MRQTSHFGILMSGLILAGLPLIAIASHWHIEAQDPRFEVRSEISPRYDAENFDIWTEISELDVSELSGTDNIKQWDTIYVHMATGPGLVAYPFAVTRVKPAARKDGHAFSIRGTVIEREDNILTLRYSFESFLPSQSLKPNLDPQAKSKAKVILAVNAQSTARLVAIELGGERYPYRVIEKPVLKGLTQ